MHHIFTYNLLATSIYLFQMAIMITNSLPLFERISHRNPLKNAVEIIISFLLLSLLLYRLLSLTKNHDFTWVLAFFCELWFTFYWLFATVTKWNPVDFKTYPDRLLQRYALMH